ncbi:hypothetical protein H0H81_000663 [Sphagnurus paluster]|uniref:Phosphatidic acid phosphatase type 2/haloperoxidase domain-containing protein n=1 Tax=Sphagnurus paluster TaxID=117069 RepID=A0A9P7FWP6_9AGAR|nr:hypothetical protein H0H81_000663 [Sphagnurus paluster]
MLFTNVSQHSRMFVLINLYLCNLTSTSTSGAVILGLALTGSITQIVKITVGRPRPDLVDRCQPPAGYTDPTFGLSSWQICTQTNASLLRDGFRSFPSASFAGLGFLAFYLAGKLHLFDRRGHTTKAWLSLAPFAAAALVAISRTMDYRHHWHDVLVGSLLGTVVSYFSYRQYFPSLASELSHRPYSPRIKREEAEEDGLPMHQPGRPSASGSDDHLDPQGHGRFYNSHPAQPDHHGLEGTVQRPGVSLEETWKDGADEHLVERSIGPGAHQVNDSA